LRDLLAERHLLASGVASEHFYCSGDPRRMASVLPILWGKNAKVEFFPR